MVEAFLADFLTVSHEQVLDFWLLRKRL